MRADPHWKRHSDELKNRIHTNQAIVAIARHLLTVIWSVLTKHEPYRYFSPERIAYKYLIWAWALHEEERHRKAGLLNSRPLSFFFFSSP